MLLPCKSLGNSNYANKIELFSSSYNRWTKGGFGMAAHNYDGDMLTDEIAQVELLAAEKSIFMLKSHTMYSGASFSWFYNVESYREK
jgi:hypothetical protein